MSTTQGTFDVDLAPAADAGAFTITKRWQGGLAGSGHGTMLSAGDPGSGSAGYVALEFFDGTLDGCTGGFAFQQYGQMMDGDDSPTYGIVPGSGSGELVGITGTLDLQIVEGEHRYTLEYSLPTV